MITKAENVRTENENIGLADRLVRLMIGGVLLGVGLIYLTITPAMFTTIGVEHLLILAIALSVYPLLTAVLGVDPIYRRFGIRTCSAGGRNQCGSLPYQLKAAVGKAPKYCEVDDEHSLEACHDDPKERPRHADWRVDQDPMLYPDDGTLEDFGKRERTAKQN